MNSDPPEPSAARAGANAVEACAGRLARALDVGGLAEWSIALPDDRWLIADRLGEIYGGGVPEDAAAANASAHAAGGVDGALDEAHRTPLTIAALGERLHADDVPRVAAGYRRLAARGTPWRTEARITRADGEPRWIRIDGAASATEDGRPTRLSGFVRDVTELKRLHLANDFLAGLAIPLSRIDDYDDTLQRVASEAVPYLADRCIIDFVEADGSLVRVADSHRPPPVSPRLPPVRPAARVPAAPLIDRIVSERRTLTLADIGAEEVRGLSATEEQREELEGFKPCDYIGTPLESEGRCFGVLGILTRRDGRRFDKQELGLIERVAERVSSALENARLYATLRRADERKEHFLAVLSHELRNPLSAIVNGIESIRDGVITPPDRASLEMIDRQTASLAHLLDDLLDVARVDADKLELELEWVSVTRAVDDALSSVAGTVRDKRQSLSSRVPVPDVAVRADRVRLEQILVNLLVNASRYTPEGGAIELEARLDAGRIAIEIVDTGVGLTSEEQSRIFDRFEQVREAGDPPVGGLGLGLSLVRRLVTLHDGTISVESAGKGFGSRFRFALPHTRGEPQDGTNGRASRPAPSERAAEPLEVLLVDDNVDVADALVRVLRRLGHAVSVRHTGEGGIVAYASAPAELVLLDIGLPDTDGFAVAERIREHERAIGVPPCRLVALTGYGQSADRARALRAGFDQHVAKPLRLAGLRELLDFAARQRGAARAPARRGGEADDGTAPAG